MLKLASDEDAQGAIVRGLRRRRPDIDLVRVHEAGLAGHPDPDVLAWAASEGRVLITNDRNTMIAHALERVQAGHPMPGLIATTAAQPIGQTIDDILLVAECMDEDEVRDRIVVYLPL